MAAKIRASDSGEKKLTLRLGKKEEVRDGGREGLRLKSALEDEQQLRHKSSTNMQVASMDKNVA